MGKLALSPSRGPACSLPRQRWGYPLPNTQRLQLSGMVDVATLCRVLGVKLLVVRSLPFEIVVQGPCMCPQGLCVDLGQVV